jgi:hypothetical protein
MKNSHLIGNPLAAESEDNSDICATIRVAITSREVTTYGSGSVNR